ncbi:hypothetical protein [Zavarzinia sp. CC-PAN008]|uniref:hypothetical protein n=1 Tax=Zavarzinia sp. CC-PAN008 TaxID=3243332 RepID=UPI003F74483E
MANRASSQAPGRPLHLVRLTDFIGGYPVVADDHPLSWRGRMVPADRVMLEVSRLASSLGPVYRRRAQPCAAADYSIATISDQRPMVLAYHSASGRVAGGYVGGNLWVVPEHRMQHLGAEIVRVAAGLWPSPLDFRGSYSKAGLATHCAAHRVAVISALDAGIRVPAEVLADYPELAHRPPRLPLLDQWLNRQVAAG